MAPFLLIKAGLPLLGVLFGLAVAPMSVQNQRMDIQPLPDVDEPAAPLVVPDAAPPIDGGDGQFTPPGDDGEGNASPTGEHFERGE